MDNSNECNRLNNPIEEICVITSYAYHVCERSKVDSIVSHYNKELDNLIKKRYMERIRKEGEIIRNIMKPDNSNDGEIPHGRSRFADYFENERILKNSENRRY